MKMLNCIIIDSNKKDLKLTKEQVMRLPFLNLIGFYYKTREALLALHRESVDLIFTETEMPELSGMELMKNILPRPKVIFVTAHPQYALESYNVNAIDYLLKPLSDTRFEKAAAKAMELSRLQDLSQIKPILPDENPDYIFVTSNYSLVKVNLEEVSHIEGLKDYLKIYTSTQTNPILTRMTMKALETKLPPQRFFRVHKSYIVALGKIEAIRNQRVKIGSYMIPVSDSNYDLFRRKVNV